MLLPLLALIAPPHFDLATYERPRLVAAAEAAATREPKTIVAVLNPRSAGGPHDFSSEGDYWWPDPAQPDGPYIQRDGLTNPDNFTGHRELLLDFARDFGTLAAAYKVTRDERHATAAVRHLKAWFVEPTTRMNPNLLYSQAIKGRFTGRSIGVIDSLHLAEVALGVEALRGSHALGASVDGAVTAWFRDYLTWIRTHPYGVTESKAENNHGTCWTLQEACFARLVGDHEAMAEARRRLVELHLPSQMAPDGSFPRELARTKPYGYSLFNLDVMAALAVVLSTEGDDLMSFALPDGRSLNRGVAFMAPYVKSKSAWLTEVHVPAKPAELQPANVSDAKTVQPDVMYWNDWPVRQPFLIFGATSTGRSDWLELWESLEPDPQIAEIRRNFPVRQPVLWMR